MEIPSDEEFRLWLDFRRTNLQGTLQFDEERNFLLIPFGGLSPIDIFEHFTHLLRDRYSRSNTSKEMQAYQWLAGEREFQRAERLVLGKKRPQPSAFVATDGWISDRASRLSAAAMRGIDAAQLKEVRNPRDESVRTLIRRIKMQEGHLALDQTFLFEWMAALHEYFFSDSWRNVLRLSRSLDESVKTAAVAVQRLLQDLDLARELHVGPKHRPPLAYRLRDALGELQIVKHGGSQQFPVRRDDARGRERLFVYRLARAHQRIWGQPKAEAIHWLMGLYGFKNQYDRRTIDRLISEFTGK
jgi:hypothetical protein